MSEDPVHGALAPAANTGRAPGRPPPSWREVPALWPLLVLVPLVFTWTKLQFGTTKSYVLATGGLALALALLKLLLGTSAGGGWTDFANALRSRALAWRLVVAIVLFLAATQFVGSVRVALAPGTTRAMIYEVTPGQSNSTRATVAARRTLDARAPEVSFLRFIPFLKPVQLVSSTNRISPAVKAGSWDIPSLAYPADFFPLPELAVLPTPKLRLSVGGDRWMRLEVREDAPPFALLADDTLRDIGARIVVFDTSVTPADTLRARWLAIAADSLQLEPALEPMVVGDWLKHHVVRTSRLLLPGERVRAALVNSKDSTIRVITITLSTGISHVVLRN